MPCMSQIRLGYGVNIKQLRKSSSLQTEHLHRVGITLISYGFVSLLRHLRTTCVYHTAETHLFSNATQVLSLLISVTETKELKTDTKAYFAHAHYYFLL